MRTKLATVGVCFTAALALAACGGSAGSGGESAESYPEEPLLWTVAFGPGGGNDIMSRTIVDILKKEKLYTEDIPSRTSTPARVPSAGARCTPMPVTRTRSPRRRGPS